MSKRWRNGHTEDKRDCARTAWGAGGVPLAPLDFLDRGGQTTARGREGAIANNHQHDENQRSQGSMSRGESSPGTPSWCKTDVCNDTTKSARWACRTLS